jgi:hypothetical protein
MFDTARRPPTVFLSFRWVIRRSNFPIRVEDRVDVEPPQDVKFNPIKLRRIDRVQGYYLRDRLSWTRRQ